MDVKDRIKHLIASRHICVLATVNGDRPYCSLMNYVIDESCWEFYMVTLRHTNKYRNLLANPRVSLMVDSRENEVSVSSWALTVEGIFDPVADDIRRKWALDKLVNRNPSLTEFLKHPDIEVVRIRVRSFLLLNGLSDSHFLTVD